MQTIYTSKKSADIFIKDKWQARDDFEYTVFEVNLYTVLGIIAFFISPILTGGFIGLILYTFWRYYQEYFSNPIKLSKYRLELAPQLSYSTYINVGYEVPDKSLEKHIEMLRRLDTKDKQAIKYLSAREKFVKSPEGKHFQVGIAKTQLTTHFWMIGTTGAGKTSLIMQLTLLLAKQGGGLMFIDGKADTKMVFKMYNILKQAGREQDFLLINFLPKEHFREHTNTFNPLADMNAPEIVEFLMSAKGEASGDQAYWAERGKAVLQAIVYPLYYRKKYYGESFTIVDINDYISDDKKFFTYLAVFDCIVRETERQLSKASFVDTFYQFVRQKKTLNEEFPYIDAIVYYFSVYPYEKVKIKDVLDTERYRLLFEAYIIASSYTKQIAQQVWAEIRKLSMILEDQLNQRGLDVLQMRIEEINLIIADIYSKNPKLMNLDGLSQALQQHAYAKQQWTSIFGTLMQYSNVFGSNSPEIDLVDVLRNNKFLYVLLPALAGSNQTTNLLGKLMLASIRKAISTALGEAVEGLTDKQRQILMKRITPMPLGLLVLDEYGAYPIKGIDTILAQVRSINISTIIATQDYTSGRAEGQDENSVKKMWANSQKIILRIKDNETLKALEEVIPERLKTKFSFIVSEDGKYIYRKDDSASIEKEKVFDAKITTAFKNGLSIFMVEDKAVITQIFWADAPEADAIYLNHSFKV